LSLQLSFEPSIFPRRIWRDIIVNVLTSSRKVLFAQFYPKINSLDLCSSRQHQISLKSVWWESSFSLRDGWTEKTDVMNLIVTFRDFANAPKCTERKGNIVSYFDLPRQMQQTRPHVSIIRYLHARAARHGAKMLPAACCVFVVWKTCLVQERKYCHIFIHL